MGLDIFKPEISQVVKGIQGKNILIYGTNRTGKTKNAVKAEKPLVLAFEAGLNALPGVPFFRINKWKDFLDLTKQLTNPATISQVQEQYKTLIIDSADGIGDLAAAHVCSVYNVATIGEGKQYCPVC